MLIHAPAALADAAKAARFYEDALTRFERKDFNGATIQLKNALQQDRKMLAAQVLLGRSLLASGDGAGAETAMNGALALGVDAAELAVPMAQAQFSQGKFNELIARPQPPNLTRAARVDLLVIRGSALAEMGDTRGAARSFDEARSIDPKVPSLLLAEANLHLRSGNLAQAEGLVQQVLAADPRSPEAWSARASLLAAQRQFDAAIEAFGRAIEFSPQAAEPRLARASVLIDMQREKDAAADLDVLAKQAPDDPRVAYMRGVIAARRGDNAAVAREMGNVAKIIDALPQELRNRRASLLLLGGMAHYSLRNTEKARAYLEQLLRLQPRHPGATRSLASIYLGLNDPKRASELLEPYIRQQPQDSQALTLLASAQMAQKRYAQASALLQQAMAQGVKDPAVQAALGASLAGQGHELDALDNLRTAFLASGNPGAGSALAVLLLRRGELSAARDVAEKMIARDARNVFAWNLLGLARAQARDTKGAREAYERALAVDPAFSAASLNLARLDLAEGRLESGRTRLTALLKREPRNVEALCDLAQADINAARFDAAKEQLLKAQSFAARNARPSLMLVDFYLNRGEAAAAVDAARSAIAQSPEHFPLRLALARAQIAAGDLARARDALTEARKLAEYDADALLEIARLQLAAAHVEGASYSVEKALAAQPANFAARELQAEIALLGNDLAAAEKLGKQLNERFPAKAAGAHVLGDVALARGKRSEGMALHKQAYARETTYTSALRVFRAYLAAADSAQGVSFLKEVLRSKGESAELLGALAEGQMRQADWQGAQHSYMRLIELLGVQVGLLNNLALVQSELSDPRAVQTAERAWKLSSSDPSVIDTYGWVLARSGQLEKGLALLREARLRDPRSLDVRYHLAWTLARSGRQREAREELAPTLVEGARFDSSAEARKLARELGN